MKEQGRNVYENKGSAFHGWEKAGNVVENKGSYALKAGMLVKRKDAGRRWYVVGGRWGRAGFRSQDSGLGRQKSRGQVTEDRERG